MSKKTVFVGMSGGVDSSVGAILLKKQGYKVVGVFIRTWHPDFLECKEEEERRDAMRVCAYLNIPFLTFDLEDVYKKEVADYMISEYKKGKTPNPDVNCNKEVKFGAFMKKALSMGADFIATGHYAQNKKKNLIKGIDSSKDQSYFLWTLKQKQLNKILFPIGHFKKTQVRKLAKKFKMEVAEKKDSQGICFLGAVDLKEFLKHYIKEKKGKVLNETGEVIGHHNGVVFHTLGERHGFTITKKNPNDGPYYVVDKDVKRNVLVVSQNPERLAFRNLKSIDPKGCQNFSLNLEKTNWIFETPKLNKNYTAQIRYHGKFLPCHIKIISNNKTKNSKYKKRAEVVFNKQILVASGQSCVIYNKNVCLGGGVIV